MQTLTMREVIIEAINQSTLLEPNPEDDRLSLLSQKKYELEQVRFYQNRLAARTHHDRPTRERLFRQFSNAVFSGEVPVESLLREFAEGFYHYSRREVGDTRPLEEFLLPSFSSDTKPGGRPPERNKFIRAVLSCYFIAQGAKQTPKVSHPKSQASLALALGGSPSAYARYWDREITTGSRFSGRDIGWALLKGEADPLYTEFGELIGSYDRSLEQLLTKLNGLAAENGRLDIEDLDIQDLKS